MKSAYHNADVARWVAVHVWVARYAYLADGIYERVVTLTAATNRETGCNAWQVTIDDVGDGPGSTPYVLGEYPWDKDEDASEDAFNVARHYRLRLREATDKHGWVWCERWSEPKPLPLSDIASES